MAARSKRRGRLRCLRPALAVIAALAPVLAGCAGHPHATGTGTAGHSVATGTGTAGPPSGVPRYFAALIDSAPQPGASEAPGEVIKVHETATGRVTGTFPLTQRIPGHDNYFPSRLAAAADQRTFFVAHPERPTSLSSSPVATDIYRFQVTGSGQITGFTEVAHSHANANGMITMAASPDGEKLATSDAAEGWDAITVADLATGQRSVWRGGLPGVNSTGMYSWEADNRTLAFTAGSGIAGSGAPGTMTEVRTLDTGTGGGSLAASHLVGTVRLPEGAGGTVLSPNGQTITAVLPGSPNSHDESPTPPDQVIQISVTSGRQTVLYSAPSHATIPTGDDFGSGITSDGNDHLLQGGAIGGGTYGAGVELAWIGGGKFHPLPAGGGYGHQITYTDFAW